MSSILEIEPIHPQLQMKRPLVIAGPCSAESAEQVTITAQQLKAMGVQVFRAGIWKPRTRPNSFEGVGKLGLPWLNKVKNEFGMLTATEVANSNHVSQALEFGVDILWIGARTTANPFAVQEIANALEGVNIPIMVKNPVNPDLELWIGAFERLYQSGVKSLAAIHRGFSNYRKTFYRNDPHWQIPIELKRRVPNLPILTDPSHICGTRERLFDVSQEAMDLNFDGLMIEVHCSPEQALSDKTQQITPQGLKDLIEKIVLREATNENAIVSHTLEELRAIIDKCDDKIIQILCKRMHVSERLGELKKDNNITIHQSNRWRKLLERRIKEGESKGLSEDFILKIFQAIHQESIDHQNNIMNK